MATWALTTPPALEPLTLSEVKNYLRIASAVTSDDAHITALITEAREYVERVTGRALITQVITEYFDSLPVLSPSSKLQTRILSLYIAPVISIDGFSYVAQGGHPSTYTIWDNTGNSKFFLDNISGGKGIGPARICLRTDVEWPDIEVYTNAVKVIYTAGYGSAAANVPGPIKRVMYRLISHWYYHPEKTDDIELVSDILNHYKVHK